ncbi:MAG: hypothetical protein EZS28_031595, partial [Streblomastix strix]
MNQIFSIGGTFLLFRVKNVVNKLCGGGNGGGAMVAQHITWIVQQQYASKQAEEDYEKQLKYAENRRKLKQFLKMRSFSQQQLIDKGFNTKNDVPLSSQQLQDHVKQLAAPILYQNEIDERRLHEADRLFHLFVSRSTNTFVRPWGTLTEEEIQDALEECEDIQA